MKVKASNHTFISLSIAVELAQESEGHRNWAIIHLLSKINDTEDDFRQDATELIIHLVDGGKLDPSRPHRMERYVLRSIANLKRRGWRDAGVKRRAIEKFEQLEHPTREEIKYDDKNLRAVQRAVQILGTTKGAIQAAADSLGITRQALRRRLRRLPGSLADYKEQTK